MKFVGDLDGDGIRDPLYIRTVVGQPVERDLELTTGGAQSNVGDLPFWTGFTSPNNATPMGGQADFDDDGRVDIIGKGDDGNLAFATVTSAASGKLNWTVKSTNMPLPSSSPSNAVWAEGIDFDGDGIMDLRFVDPLLFNEHIILHRTKNPFDWMTNKIDLNSPTAPTICTAKDCSTSGLGVARVLDLNGDGFVDTVFDDGYLSNIQSDPTQVALFAGPDSVPPYSYAYLGSCVPNSDNNVTCKDQLDLGGPAAQGTMPIELRGWIDVNGDGLPDMYAIQKGTGLAAMAAGGTIFVNKGGPIGSQLFQPKSLGVASIPTVRLQQAFVMDIDGDGQDELLVPNHRVEGYEYCVCGGDAQCKFPEEPLNYSLSFKRECLARSDSDQCLDFHWLLEPSGYLVPVVGRR